MLKLLKSIHSFSKDFEWIEKKNWAEEEEEEENRPRINLILAFGLKQSFRVFVAKRMVLFFLLLLWPQL